MGKTSFTFLGHWVWDPKRNERLFPASEEVVKLWETQGRGDFDMGWHGITRKVTIRDGQGNPPRLPEDNR